MKIKWWIRGLYMTIYWDRCDLCGQYRPTSKCSLFPEIMVDVHCCFACPHREGKCKTPVWRVETLIQPQVSRKGLSDREKEKLLKELTTLLKTS